MKRTTSPSTAVLVACSEDKPSAIVNPAGIQGSANIAAGRDAEANMGPVVVKQGALRCRDQGGSPRTSARRPLWVKGRAVSRTRGGEGTTQRRTGPAVLHKRCG